MHIQKARISYQGWRGGRERAASIAQDALRAVRDGARTAIGGRIADAQVTVRVAPGTSDAQIARRVAEAVRRVLTRGEGG